MFLRMMRSDGVVERKRLFVEAHPRSFQHRNARQEGLQLAGEVGAPVRLRSSRSFAVYAAQDDKSFFSNVGKRASFRLGAPFRRTVVRVDVIGIVLAHGQDELHVTFGNL